MPIRVFGDRRELEQEVCRELATRPTLGSPQWRPLRLLVPTPIDRLHLAARLVADGASHLGVRIQSLHGFCLELLAGERPVRVLPRMLTRRLARHRPSLASLVDDFEGGDDVVTEAVERLLAAGLEPVLLAPALESLGPASSPPSRRIADLLEVSLAVSGVVEAGELVGSWHVPARAVRQISRRPPAEVIWGVGLPLRADLDDVIAALVAAGGRWWCESPGGGGRPGVGAARIGRLARLGASEVHPVELAPPTLRATASFDEALAVTVAELLEGLADGCSPEECTVAYHDPEQGRRALEALADGGVEAVAPLLRASPDGAGRLRMALARLVAVGPATSLGHGLVIAGAEDRELLAAWRSLGKRTLGDIATADLDAVLGDRAAVVVPTAGGDRIEATATTGTIDRDRLTRSAAQAGELLAAWQAFHDARDLRQGLAALEHFASALGPSAEAMCREAGCRLEAEIPAALVLEPGELAVVLAAELGDTPAAADGGGVRILPVAVAAESSWRLAIVVDSSAAALEPRRRDDPLFPETLLRRLEVVLPGLREQRDVEPEEALLRLTAGGGRVTWVYSRRDHTGAPAIASALWHWAQSRGAEIVEALPEPGRPRALHRTEVSSEDPALERHRAAVAHAIDHVVGPFGARLGLVAPRREGWWATRLEAAAQCPWRHVLERRLGLAEVLDEPGLGALDTRLVGSLVHAALERLAREALDRPSRRLELPQDLAAWLHPLAGPVTSGGGAPLLARAAAERAAVFLRAAWRLPQIAEGRVLAAEPVGEVEIEGVSVRFRADLALDTGAGPEWIDFKVGSVPEPRSDSWLEREVASGRRLQAALYARLHGVASSAYVFLGDPERRELDPLRWLAVDGRDPAIERALAAATVVTAAAAELGVAIPRLVGPDLEREGPWCRHCRVGDACSRGVSGIRRRLVRWAEQDQAQGDEAEIAAKRILRLGASS